MARFTLYGILLIVGIFLVLLPFILTQIDVTNPITGIESSIWSTIIGWIIN